MSFDMLRDKGGDQSQTRIHSECQRSQAARSLLDMSFGSTEQTLPDKRLTEQELNIFFSPVPCRQGLEEHHDFLKVHLQELVGPFDKEGNADVKVKLREALLLGLNGC